MTSTGNRAAARPASLQPYSEREENILDALEEIFLQEGFRRVSVGGLAARLRCSRRTLYRLAPSKERLFLLVLSRLLLRIREKGRKAYERATAFQDRIVRGMAPGVTELRKASALFSVDIASFPAAKQLLEEHQGERVEVARDLIEEGISKRVLRGIHPRLVAEAMLAAVQRVMEPELLAEVGLSMSEAVNEIEDLFLHGLLHPSSGAGNTRKKNS